ncbi:MAG: hypothetical protein QOI79_2914 [Mycobacterium sp.]|jgi:hypothetical protein|nr:hypothetical protein [Mycobacterium sp.]MDT5143551.1 hypothetical protein [Mycobacterium sp.]
MLNAPHYPVPPPSARPGELHARTVTNGMARESARLMAMATSRCPCFRVRSRLYPLSRARRIPER